MVCSTTRCGMNQAEKQGLTESHEFYSVARALPETHQESGLAMSRLQAQKTVTTGQNALDMETSRTPRLFWLLAGSTFLILTLASALVMGTGALAESATGEAASWLRPVGTLVSLGGAAAPLPQKTSFWATRSVPGWLNQLTANGSYRSTQGGRRVKRSVPETIGLLSLPDSAYSVMEPPAGFVTDTLVSARVALGTSRHDPFKPLVTLGGDANPEFGDPDVEADPFKNIQFTGVIRDNGDSVAIMRLNDSTLGGITQIKRPGDTFELNGSTGTVKKVSDEALIVQWMGQRREIALNVFVDNIATSSEAEGEAVDTAAANGTGKKAKESFDELEELEEGRQAYGTHRVTAR